MCLDGHQRVRLFQLKCLWKGKVNAVRPQFHRVADAHPRSGPAVICLWAVSPAALLPIPLPFEKPYFRPWTQILMRPSGGKRQTGPTQLRTTGGLPLSGIEALTAPHEIWARWQARCLAMAVEVSTSWTAKTVPSMLIRLIHDPSPKQTTSLCPAYHLACQTSLGPAIAPCLTLPPAPLVPIASRRHKSRTAPMSS